MLLPWHDALITDPIDLQTFANPLRQSNVNGNTGEVKTGEFYLAMAQAALAAAINDSVTTLTFKSPLLITASYPVIIRGTEKMLVTAGFGTDEVTVVRGYNGTTAAAHDEDDIAYAAYKAINVSVTAVDLDLTTDESGWLKVRHHGTGSYESPHAVEDIDYDDVIHLDYQVTVPEWPAALKRDLTPRVACRLGEIENP